MIAAVPADRDRPVAIPFDEVYRDHADAVFRYCVSQVGSTVTGEDICGDVFASAYAAYERTAPEPDGVRPWLFRIARNKVIDHARGERRRRLLVGRLRRERVASSTVEDDAARRGALASVTAAMEHLGARDRQLVGLRVAGGLSYADVGAVMGLSEHATVVATQRALQRLRARLGDER